MRDFTRRKYTIKASIRTLNRFGKIVFDVGGDANAFVEKVIANASDEYYYVTLLATPEVHDELKAGRFDNSQALKL